MGNPECSVKIYEKIWARDNRVRAPRRNRAMVKSFKVSNGKRYATKMNVRCWGNVYNEFCFDQTPFDTGWKKNTDARRKRMCLRFWPPTAQQTFNMYRHYMQGEITGQFRVNGQITNLVWQ